MAFEPTRRIVPTTKTKITASITAYSAMSWPRSSVQSWGRILICLQFLSTAKIRTLGWKCQRQERPSAAGSGIRNLVLISLWRLCSRAPAMSIEWTAMPNSVLGATFSRFKHWRCLPFVLFVFPVQLTSVIKNKRQSGFTRAGRSSATLARAAFAHRACRVASGCFWRKRGEAELLPWKTTWSQLCPCFSSPSSTSWTSSFCAEPALLRPCRCLC